MTQRHLGNRAVVLGASLAGLLAARVLADAFAEVLVVERDELPVAGTARSEVVRGRRPRILLARGQQILEELFPGFTEDLAVAGVPTAEVGQLRWHLDGQRLAPADTGLRCVSASRPVFDGQLTARVRALPNVRFAERTEALAVVADSDRNRLLGVRVLSQQTGSSEEVVEAELVIDATGPGSRTPLWLSQLGYAQPEEDRADLGLTGVTRHFGLPHRTILDDVLSIHLAPSPQRPRGAVLSRVEDGRCVLTLTGTVGERPPADLEGFLAWARTLPAPEIYEVVKDADPLDDPVGFSFQAGRRRYEQLDRLPERLLVVGDAVCGLDPLHGQDITVAAQQALVLREHLQHGMPQALVFQKEVAAVIDVPWSRSSSGGLDLWAAETERAEDAEVGKIFTARLRQAATRDPVLARALLRVVGLVDPPHTLMTADTVARVLGPDLGR